MFVCISYHIFISALCSRSIISKQETNFSFKKDEIYVKIWARDKNCWSARELQSCKFIQEKKS